MSNFNKAIAALSQDEPNFHGNNYYEGTPKGREIVRIVEAGIGHGRSLSKIAEVLNKMGYKVQSGEYDCNKKCWIWGIPFQYKHVYYIVRNVINARRAREHRH